MALSSPRFSARVYSPSCRTHNTIPPPTTDPPPPMVSAQGPPRTWDYALKWRGPLETGISKTMSRRSPRKPNSGSQPARELCDLARRHAVFLTQPAPRRRTPAPAPAPAPGTSGCPPGSVCSELDCERGVGRAPAMRVRRQLRRRHRQRLLRRLSVRPVDLGVARFLGPAIGCARSRAGPGRPGARGKKRLGPVAFVLKSAGPRLRLDARGPTVATCRRRPAQRVT